MSKGQLVTLPQAAKMAGISEATIRRMISDGWIETYQIAGSRWLYYRDFLRASWEREQKKDPRGIGYGDKGRRTDLGY